NVPASRPDQGGSESDLTRTDKASIQKAYPNWEFQVVTDPRLANYGNTRIDDDAALSERAAVGPILAHWALVLALLLIFAEVILAWR
ncbi:hypothetical protein NL533_33120, partial [Klebsiella pneumoniae]|nr:hypothetical protein [Klebsiella pneumoniae]